MSAGPLRLAVGARLFERPNQRQTSLARRRKERELFFWTAFMALKLILASALVLYVVVALIDNEVPGRELLQALGSF